MAARKESQPTVSDTKLAMKRVAGWSKVKRVSINLKKAANADGDHPDAPLRGVSLSIHRDVPSDFSFLLPFALMTEPSPPSMGSKAGKICCFHPRTSRITGHGGFPHPYAVSNPIGEHIRCI